MSKVTCLLANTSKTASLSSSSASILMSSSLASPTLSLSLLSTTKIKPKTQYREFNNPSVCKYNQGNKLWYRLQQGSKHPGLHQKTCLWINYSEL